jgi:predicted ferric reductase
MMTQLVLASRIHALDRVFGLDKLMRKHRFLGIAVLPLSALHPVLVFLPEGIWTVQFRLDYWPEHLGIFLVVGIWATVFMALLYKRLGIRFERWWLGHQIITPILILGMGVHTLYVSETFSSGFPRIVLIIGLIIALLLLIWIWLRPIRRRTKEYQVAWVKPASNSAMAIGLIPQGNNDLAFAPGQFSFVTFRSAGVSQEEHPFTIASNPGISDHLEFIIKASGDWTREVACLQAGETAYLDGPYGLFSYLSFPKGQEFICIAGGIGITPFFSMLRHMHSVQEKRPLSLIWSNRSQADMVYSSEIKELEDALPSLRVHRVFTREPKANHLDQEQMDKFLEQCSRKAHCFLCGPPKMMKDMRSILLCLGFDQRHIHQELFSL